MEIADHRPDWLESAACRGKEDVFFPPIDAYDGAKWERDSEQAAKAVCSACPVRNACAAFFLDSSDSGAASPGVYGGMNRWERAWLADNREAAKRLAAELDSIGVDPAELRSWCAAAGTDCLSGEESVKACSLRVGFPEETVAEWYRQRGIAGPPRWTRPWRSRSR